MVLRSLDKLGKVTREDVQKEMAERAGVTSAQSSRLLEFVQMTGTNADVLSRLKSEFGSNAKAGDGIRRLEELLSAVSKAGIPDGMIVLDLSIARGLDYYTGTVYETFLTDMPKIGSVCSGGRYDNLAGLYTKQSLPGVGASLGLDRLLAADSQAPLRLGLSAVIEASDATLSYWALHHPPGKPDFHHADGRALLLEPSAQSARRRQ